MDLADKIRAEREQAERQRERARAEVTRLDDKITELDAALRVIGRFVEPASDSTADGAPGGPLRRGEQKELIEKVLRQAYPGGLEAAEIPIRIKEMRGVEVTANTTNVTLNRMREVKRARNEGRVWFYVLADAESAGAPPKEAPADPQPRKRGSHGPA